MTNEPGIKRRRDMRAAIGAGNFKSWIEPPSLVSASEGVAHLASPNPFVGDCVGKTCGDQIIYHQPLGPGRLFSVLRLKSKANPAS
jgi:chromosomal replication initiator protein